ALLAAKLDDFLAGRRELDVLFQPTERRSLAGYTTTRSAIVLEVLDNVRSRITLVRPEGGRWTPTPVAGLPEFGSISATAVDDITSDGYWLTVTDFLTPTTLLLDADGRGSAESLKQTPAFFDGARDAVSQHEAVSKDGTRVPYFEVAPKTLARTGAPTLLT